MKTRVLLIALVLILVIGCGGTDSGIDTNAIPTEKSVIPTVPPEECFSDCVGNCEQYNADAEKHAVCWKSCVLDCYNDVLASCNAVCDSSLEDGSLDGIEHGNCINWCELTFGHVVSDTVEVETDG